jgi:hypothetical protein
MVRDGTRSRRGEGVRRQQGLRFWSLDDPSLHQAMYQFDDEAKLAAMLKGDALNKLVADFNRDWPDVKRTRETLVLAQEFGT